MNIVEEEKQRQKMKKFLELYKNGLGAENIERIAKVLSLPKKTCAGWEKRYKSLRSDPVRFMFSPWEPLNNWISKPNEKFDYPGSLGEWIHYRKIGPGTRVFHYDRLKNMKNFTANSQFLYNIGPLDSYETAEKRTQSGKDIIENNVITYMFKITKKGYKPYYLGPYTEHVSGGDKWSSLNYHYHTYWGYYQTTLRKYRGNRNDGGNAESAQGTPVSGITWYTDWKRVTKGNTRFQIPEWGYVEVEIQPSSDFGSVTFNNDDYGNVLRISSYYTKIEAYPWQVLEWSIQGDKFLRSLLRPSCHLAHKENIYWDKDNDSYVVEVGVSYGKKMQDVVGLMRCIEGVDGGQRFEGIYTKGS